MFSLMQKKEFESFLKNKNYQFDDTQIEDILTNCLPADNRMGLEFFLNDIIKRFDIYGEDLYKFVKGSQSIHPFLTDKEDNFPRCNHNEELETYSERIKFLTYEFNINKDNIKQLISLKNINFLSNPQEGLKEIKNMFLKENNIDNKYFLKLMETTPEIFFVYLENERTNKVSKENIKL